MRRRVRSLARAHLGGLAMILALAATAGSAMTAGAARAQESAARAEIAAEVEDYLNSIRTLSAKFLQIAPDGGVSTGTVVIDRPGLMRIEYAPPVPVLIIADGTWLLHYDKELEQATYAPLDETLAGFLLRDKIRFSGDIMLKGVKVDTGVIRVSIARRDAPEGGVLTLVFGSHPLRLRQWAVTDEAGDTTRVALEDTAINGDIDPGAFEFTPPERRRVED